MLIEGLTTLLGGALGGALRLAPELLKLWDRKDERKHELAMLDKNLEADRQRGELRLAELNTAGGITLDGKGLDALIEGIRGQSQKSGVLWIDGLSQLMRPIITLQWVVILYPAVIVASTYSLIVAGTSTAEAIKAVFGPEERTIVAGIINFWFLDRVIKKRA